MKNTTVTPELTPVFSLCRGGVGGEGVSTFFFLDIVLQLMQEEEEGREGFGGARGGGRFVLCVIRSAAHV